MTLLRQAPIWAFVVCWLVTGCRQRQSNDAFQPIDSAEFADHSTLPTKSLPSRVLTNDSMIGGIHSLGVYQRWLIITDPNGVPFIHIIDRQSGRIISSLGQRGEGPGDFTRVPQLLSSPPTPSGNIWFFDPNISRYTALNGSALAGDRTVQPFTATFATTEPYIQSTIALEDSNFVAVKKDASSEVPVVVRLTKSGSKMVGPIPLHDSRNDVAGLANAYTSLSVCGAPARDRFVISYLYAGRVDIVDSNGTLLKQAAVPFPALPTAQVDKSGRTVVQMGAGTKLHYGACATTRDAIYVLFLNLVRGPRWRIPSLPRSYVHVFDWEGKLLQVIQLDHGTEVIGVDSDGMSLYSAATDSSGAPQILETRLK